MRINEVCREAHATAVERGWYGPEGRGIPELIALMHSELSEALEEYRNGDVGDLPRLDNNGKPLGLAIEFADALIRICDAAAYLGIDLEHAVVLKMRYNRTRPHRHGGKLA